LIILIPRLCSSLRFLHRLRHIQLTLAYRDQETNSKPSGIRTFQVVLSVNVSPWTARPYAQTSQVQVDGGTYAAKYSSPTVTPRTTPTYPKSPKASVAFREAPSAPNRRNTERARTHGHGPPSSRSRCTSTAAAASLLCLHSALDRTVRI
jgi:hypothetical protein